MKKLKVGASVLIALGRPTIGRIITMPPGFQCHDGLYNVEYEINGETYRAFFDHQFLTKNAKLTAHEVVVPSKFKGHIYEQQRMGATDYQYVWPVEAVRAILKAHGVEHI